MKHAIYIQILSLNSSEKNYKFNNLNKIQKRKTVLINHFI